jgi:hypothetical protein
LSAKPTALEQYIYVQDLCDRNETLFHATLMSDRARFVPIVYDPTIADACLTYGHIYRRPQGMYLNKRMKGRFAGVLADWPVKDIRFICVSSADASSVWGTSARTARRSRSANSSSIQPVPRFRLTACYRSVSTSAPRTQRFGLTRSTRVCATSPRPRRAYRSRKVAMPSLISASMFGLWTNAPVQARSCFSGEDEEK